MKKLLAAVLVLTFALMACASAEGITFKMGIDAEYPPYSYMGDDGNYTGYDVEMCQKVCEILGWKQEIVPINWDTKLIQLDANEIDCIWSGLTIDVIDPNAYTLSTPYADNFQMILTKKGSGIETLADVAGKTVGVQMSTSAENLLTKGAAVDFGNTFGQLAPYEDYNKCFLVLQAGAIDAIAIDIGVAADKIAKYGDEYYTVAEPFGTEKYGICFRKADTELCAQVEGAFMQLVADGTYMSLAEKYGLDVNNLCLKAQ